MNSAKPENDLRKNRLLIVLIAVATAVTIMISLYYLFSGSFNVFQNLFYIPIILSCMYYTMRGFIYSVCLALFYLLLILLFTWESSIIVEALARVVLFIGIAGVVTFLAIRHARAMQKLRENEEIFQHLFEDSTDPILLLDGEDFVDCNPACVAILGYTSKDEVIGRSPWDLSPLLQPDGRSSSEKAAEIINLAIRNGHHRFEWIHLKSDGTEFPVEVVLTPIVIRGKQCLHVVWRDIADRKRAEKEREKLILELRKALSQVKTLSGLLPICASCKRIRNDKGSWEQMEVYVRDHSEAEFSHSICPECAEKLYPEYYKKK